MITSPRKLLLAVVGVPVVLFSMYPFVGDFLGSNGFHFCPPHAVNPDCRNSDLDIVVALLLSVVLVWATRKVVRRVGMKSELFFSVVYLFLISPLTLNIFSNTTGWLFSDPLIRDDVYIFLIFLLILANVLLYFVFAYMLSDEKILKKGIKSQKKPKTAVNKKANIHEKK
jgi:hypothetical protein